MTFCFFSAQYLPTPGGVERYTWNLARRCVAAGHRALIVTSALPGQPARERDADGLEIFRLPAIPVMGGRFPVLRPFAPAADLWAQKIDFAVIQTRMYTQSIWAAWQCRQRNIPALVIDHSTGYMMQSGLGGILGRWYEHLACALIQQCGFPFYGVSQDVCHWLETFGIRAEGTLPNAVDPAELEALAQSDPTTDWRQKLQVPPDGHLILFIGRLIPEKGALALAQAMAYLPDCVLAVAGIGPQEEALRAMGGSVKVLGALPHRQIVQLLAQADCYCLPTRYAEGFPTTLLEAAACRCPILCTHTAGTGELLPDDRYAVFLEDTTPPTLADALRTLLSAPETAQHRAEQAFCNLSAHFTWQAVFATMMKIAQSAQSRREKEPRCPNYSS